MNTLSATARRSIAAASLAAAAALTAACGSTPGGGTSAGGSQAAPQSGSPSAASQGPARSTSAPPSASSPSAPSPAAPSPAAPSPSVSSPAPSSPGTGLTACATSALSVSLPTVRGGGAAGSIYLPLDFTNTSGRACTMYGYPGVSFVTGRGGSQIGAAAARNHGFGSVPVTLDPHATAHAWLQVAEAGNYPSTTCHMVTATWLRVYPPGETAAAYVNHMFSACASAKASLLTVMPVRPGAGRAGQVP